MYELDAAYAADLEDDAAPARRPPPGKRTLTAAIQRSAPGHPPAPAAAPVAKDRSEPAAPTAPADDPFWFCGGGGQPLAAPVRTQMELAFGADFSGVRVHVGDAAPAVGALAYAQGEALHFAPGQYDPGSASGQELIGHELAHVVQQRQGRVATAQGKGAPINADPALESEADAAGAAAAAGRSVGATLAGVSARAATGDAAIQRKVGFEVEVSILLSQGGPTQDEPTATPAAFVSSDDLLTGPYSDPDTLASKYGTRIVLVKTKVGDKMFGLRWDKGSYAKHDGGRTALKPTRVETDEPGRWLVIQGWDPATDPTGRAYDPHLGKSEKVFSKTQAAPFDVVEDHVAQTLAGELGSILEFVTEPRDEFAVQGETRADARTRFLEPIRAVRAAVATIESELGGQFSRRVPAAHFFPGARADLYVGWDGSSGQSHHASLQATFGLRLDGVAEMMAERATGFNLLSEPRILEKSMDAARSAMKTLGWDPSLHPRLDGFLHLVAMYLVAGHPTYLHLCSLDKNHVPFLIRHGLPSIRSAGLDAKEQQLLLGKKPVPEVFDLRTPWNGDSQPSIIDVLAAAADRSSGQALFSFKQGAVSVKSWLEAVLYGDADPLMDDFWGEAKEIAPEQVGTERCEPGTGEPLSQPGTGAILEQRHAAGGLAAPDQWEPIAESFFDKMRRYND